MEGNREQYVNVKRPIFHDYAVKRPIFEGKTALIAMPYLYSMKKKYFIGKIESTLRNIHTAITKPHR